MPGCCGMSAGQVSRWKHTAPDGTETVKKHKHEVDWLLRKHGGTIEQVNITR